MVRYRKRRQRRRLFLGNVYMSSSMQYAVTVVSAILLAGLVFSGVLLFRYTAQQDLIGQSKQLIAEGKVAKAEEVLRRLVTSHQDSYEGHLLLGKVYLELGDRQKAEQQFKTASTLKTKGGANTQAADVAMSKLAIAQKNYDSAEQFLVEAYKKNKKDTEVQRALFELYDSWGDTLSTQDPRDYTAIIKKYEKALKYVDEYRLEDSVKEKLMENISTYAEDLNRERQYQKSIIILEKSLKYRYLPDTLVQIADAYDRLNKLDESIDWYRKAFDADPNIISIRLTDVLLKKGRQLLDEKKPKEAQKYFEEAEQIGKIANIPLDVLYPVRVADVQVNATVDNETGEFMPNIKVKVANESERDINFLALKVVIMSGDQEITSIKHSVASPDKKLPAKDKKNSTISLNIKPSEPLNVHSLPQRQILVKIYIAYNEGENQIWKAKANHEVVIRDNKPPAEADPPDAKPV